MALGKLKRPALGALRGAVRVDDARVGQAIYNTQRWKQLSAMVRRAYHACMWCGASGGRLYLDHKVELADGGEPFEPANLWLLCGKCHARKSAAQRRARA